MIKFYKLKKPLRFLALIFLVLTGLSNARAASSKSDLSIIGMNGDADATGSTMHRFAVVVLNSIAEDEVIFITNGGWVNPFVSFPASFTTITTLEGTIH